MIKLSKSFIDCALLMKQVLLRKTENITKNLIV